MYVCVLKTDTCRYFLSAANFFSLAGYMSVEAGVSRNIRQAFQRKGSYSRLHASSLTTFKAKVGSNKRF